MNRFSSEVSWPRWWCSRSSQLDVAGRARLFGVVLVTHRCTNSENGHENTVKRLKKSNFFPRRDATGFGFTVFARAANYDSGSKLSSHGSDSEATWQRIWPQGPE
ncbi:hypothetical protein B0H14DRAFT_2577489 [Mycena olivaceomarginata]|nr:hypothetical protein B0H14DRAFT_2577489 [Mycena olivaceomarginata]